MKLDIQAADGVCPTSVFTPNGEGPWPGVLMFMDAPGIRPAMEELAARLASEGFAVLLPDLFYRTGPYEPIDAKRVFGDPALREAHRARHMGAQTSPRNMMADTACLLDWMAASSQIQPGPVGVVGYCMGGRLALLAAGTFLDRIGAAASYHGGGLANDAPASPHLLAAKMRARVYVAGAVEDANFDDAQRARLIAALSEAGVDHEIETYPARHGWVPRETADHDPAEAEHHWRTLVPFLTGALR